MPLTFRLIPPFYQDARSIPDRGADFLLEEDRWNDFNYFTQYHLHATSRITQAENEYWGKVKIMRVGQQEGEQDVLRRIFADNLFESLPEGYVSLSLDIDLFVRINQRLDADSRRNFVEAMRLILGKDSPWYDSVRSDLCFSYSLLRDTSINSFSLIKGRQLLLGSETFYDLRRQTLEITFPDTVPFSVSFGGVEGVEGAPNGVVAFIGKNGSGKSTAVYRLAKLLYADPSQRHQLRDDVGEIEPNDAGISKLFLVSYSPFDNFVLPGIGIDDYRKLLSGLQDGKGRLVFCGIRDIKAEIEQLMAGNDPKRYAELYKQQRLNSTLLKPVEALASEYVKDSCLLDRDGDKLKLWYGIMEAAKTNFQEISEAMLPCNCFAPDNKERFMKLSTGHKFFLHSLIRIVRHIENNCIVLFDEPENHIHPPLLSFMMAAYRRILDKYRSVMLIATHSPVVVQEICSRNVFVVRANGANAISHPAIQTYGANTAEIVSEAFGLTTDITNYYDIFDRIYEQWRPGHDDSADALLQYASDLLGSLNSQSTAYLVCKYYNDRP